MAGKEHQGIIIVQDGWTRRELVVIKEPIPAPQPSDGQETVGLNVLARYDFYMTKNQFNWTPMSLAIARKALFILKFQNMAERDTSNLYIHLKETHGNGRFVEPKAVENKHYHPTNPSPFANEGHLLAPYRPFFVGENALVLRHN